MQSFFVVYYEGISSELHPLLIWPIASRKKSSDLGTGIGGTNSQKLLKNSRKFLIFAYLKKWKLFSK